MTAVPITNVSKLPFAPVGKHLARRDLRRSFQALGRHLKGPRDNHGNDETQREQHDQRLH